MGENKTEYYYYYYYYKYLGGTSNLLGATHTYGKATCVHTCVAFPLLLLLLFTCVVLQLMLPRQLPALTTIGAADSKTSGILMNCVRGQPFQPV